LFSIPFNTIHIGHGFEQAAPVVKVHCDEIGNLLEGCLAIANMRDQIGSIGLVGCAWLRDGNFLPIAAELTLDEVVQNVQLKVRPSE